MGKGGGSKQQVTTTQSDISKELRPYREEILGAAQDLFRGGYTPYQSTYVAPTQETLDALSGMQQQAALSAPMFQTQRDVLMQNLTGTNPLLQQALKPTIEAAMQPAMSTGRYGSGYAQRGVAEAVAPLIYSAQQEAMGQVPSVYQSGMSPFLTMAQVGAAREQIEQERLAEEAMEAQYPYLAQRGLLSDYASLFGGVPMGQTGQNITPISKPSPLGQIAGIGLQGLGMVAGAPTGGIMEQIIAKQFPSLLT